MIESLAKEKGFEPDEIVTIIEEAYLAAARKYYKADENLRTKCNPETGQVELYAVRQIVEEVTDELTEISLAEAQQLYGDEAEVDMEIEFPKPTDVLGRIAAQAAKQFLVQKFRELEREIIYNRYHDRTGEVVAGVVKRFENGDIIVEFDRVEALLPRREQSRADNYSAGDRIKSVIQEVNKDAKGPQIVLSRAADALLVKQFEQEVPEIYDQIVRIHRAVREAGERAKVAVYSHERDIDPVGACVGMKGTRVQAIIRELRGEKIDIVQWSDDPVTFVTNALKPARVQHVSVVDGTDRVIEVVVDDSQLSLAIGKKGQNVRLAAKLTGWRVEIRSAEQARAAAEARFKELEAATLTLPGLTSEQRGRLIEAGLDTSDSLLEATAERIAEVAGIDQAAADAVQLAVRRQIEMVESSNDESAEAESNREQPLEAAAATAAAVPSDTTGQEEIDESTGQERTPAPS